MKFKALAWNQFFTRVLIPEADAIKIWLRLSLSLDILLYYFLIERKVLESPFVAELIGLDLCQDHVCVFFPFSEVIDMFLKLLLQQQHI